MQNLIKKTLNTSKTEKKLVSLFTDKENTHQFRIGVVEGFDNEFLLVKLINDQGHFDGYLILKIANIYCLVYDDQQIQNIVKLLDGSFLDAGRGALVHLNNFFRFEDAISICLAKPYMVNIIMDQGKDLKGIIKEFDGQNVCVDLVMDDNGVSSYSGTALININDVREIFLGEAELVDVSKIAHL